MILIKSLEELFHFVGPPPPATSCLQIWSKNIIFNKAFWIKVQ